jgi:hypothetical protein
MNSEPLISPLSGFVLGALGTYVAFYFRGALARREQIAKSLAGFYASAATAYYARKDYEDADESNSDRMTFYKLYDQHYREFLSSSTFLAALVPPKLKDEVLSVEDLWDGIGSEGFEQVSGKKWFDALDTIRDKILNSIRYSRVTDPFWKG